MSFFNKHQNIAIGKAPGRMDVMGGIADYSGSLVLQMPIQEVAIVQAAFRQDSIFRVYSVNLEQTLEINATQLPKSYEAAQTFFAQQSTNNWAAYILGCLIVLKKEKSENFSATQQGIDFWVDSAVPLGKGVSSSAAIEIATMRALAQLYHIAFQGTEMAILAQKVENLVVGAPCGLMDQLACSFGKNGHLLPILCQPDQLFPLISLPKELTYIGIDSGIRHAVSDASYGEVRTAAFMGYSIIALAGGCTKAAIHQAKKTGQCDDLPYKGYLCNITPVEFEKKYLPLLPKTITGADFLALYGGIIDAVTTIKADHHYKVLSCTQHPIKENFRVQLYRETLHPAIREKKPLTAADLALLGELMYQSHESYSNCGLGNVYTDEIVEMVKLASPESGVYGAKITGGGSGGTVCVLCYGAQGITTAREIFQTYQRKYGRALKFIV